MKNEINLKSICYNSSNNDNFVGLKFINDEARVYFPLGYNIPSDNNECRLSILNILKTISLAKNLVNSANEYSINDGNKDEVPINSFLFVLNDYLINGLYKDKEKVFKRGQSGKINWKKTLNTNFYISENRIVYLNPYVEKNTLYDNIITDIHAYVINVSVKYIGWLFGSFKKLQTNVNEINIKYYISIINKEMVHTFDDRKKTLLINLKKILELCGGNYKSKLSDYGVYKYEHAFEYMVNYVFSTEDVLKYFPSSSWYILDWEEIPASKLRPDTILTVDNDIYILDSKYYKFGITANPLDLPQTESIQKQITYAEHVSKNKKFNYKNIYNAFIIPYNKLDNKFNFHENIKYIGFSESNWKENKKNNLYEHVSLILIDTKYLIDCYFNKENKDTIKLINSIREVIYTFDRKNYL